MNKKITQQCNVFSHQQTNNTSLQYTKFQPVDLSDEGSIYRCLARVWVSSGFLISVISLIVLGSTWRFNWSLSHPKANSEASVTGEVSVRFHDHPLSKLSLPFVYSLSSHPTEGHFSMHRTWLVLQPVCIAPSPWSNQYGLVLASSE